ncbi:MAG: hypothetical protein MJ252_26635 [archaeon]|nr:hypothetical protein [archaeon]
MQDTNAPKLNFSVSANSINERKVMNTSNQEKKLSLRKGKVTNLLDRKRAGFTMVTKEESDLLSAQEKENKLREIDTLLNQRQISIYDSFARKAKIFGTKTKNQELFQNVINAIKEPQIIQDLMMNSQNHNEDQITSIFETFEYAYFDPRRPPDNPNLTDLLNLLDKTFAEPTFSEKLKVSALQLLCKLSNVNGIIPIRFRYENLLRCLHHLFTQLTNGYLRLRSITGIIAISANYIFEVFPQINDEPAPQNIQLIQDLGRNLIESGLVHELNNIVKDIPNFIQMAGNASEDDITTFSTYIFWFYLIMTKSLELISNPTFYGLFKEALPYFVSSLGSIFEIETACSLEELLNVLLEASKVPEFQEILLTNGIIGYLTTKYVCLDDNNRLMVNFTRRRNILERENMSISMFLVANLLDHQNKEIPSAYITTDFINVFKKLVTRHIAYNSDYPNNQVSILTVASNLAYFPGNSYVAEFFKDDTMVKKLTVSYFPQELQRGGIKQCTIKESMDLLERIFLYFDAIQLGSFISHKALEGLKLIIRFNEHFERAVKILELMSNNCQRVDSTGGLRTLLVEKMGQLGIMDDVRHMFNTYQRGTENDLYVEGFIRTWEEIFG